MNSATTTTWAEIWKDKKYLQLHKRKDALGAAWNRADACKEPEAPALEKAFVRAIHRINKYEAARGL